MSFPLEYVPAVDDLGNYHTKTTLSSSLKTQESINTNSRNLRIKKPKAIKDNLHITKIKKPKKSSLPKRKNKETKIIQSIFSNFKSLNPNYNEFSQLTKIEKKIKSKLYLNYAELAKELRNAFNFYFNAFSDNIIKYTKIFDISNSFESIYKEYGNKIFMKESKTLIEIKKRLNKMKRELRDAYMQNNYNDNNCTNRLKIAIDENKQEKSSIRKYKVTIANNISLLSQEQKKGMLPVIANNYLDKNNTQSAVEFDINKMSLNQLRQIENYINKCLFDNSNSNNCSSTDLVSQKSNDFIQKENDIFNDNDISESLSSDEDEEDN